MLLEKVKKKLLFWKINYSLFLTLTIRICITKFNKFAIFHILQIINVHKDKLLLAAIST